MRMGARACGQWIVGAADGADTVVARIDGVRRAFFFARAATVSRGTIWRPLAENHSRGPIREVGRTWIIEGGRLLPLERPNRHPVYILTGESFDSTKV